MDDLLKAKPQPEPKLEKTFIEDPVPAEQTIQENKDIESHASLFEYGSYEAKVASNLNLNETTASLDLSRMPNVSIAYKDIDKASEPDFAMIRRTGFGGSDSSVLLGVNPYTKWEDLIKQKASTELSEEELATGQQIPVMKGRDLEPVVLMKFQKYFGTAVVKPVDMYRLNDFPYLTMNFDGVIDTKGQYVPVEAKIVTSRGARHYIKPKAMFVEREGFKPLQPNVVDSNLGIVAKAANYGIPPYYYTQLQAEMMFLDAPHGYLAALFEADWQLCVFFMLKDQAVWDQLKIEGWRAFQAVEALKHRHDHHNTIDNML